MQFKNSIFLVKEFVIETEEIPTEVEFALIELVEENLLESINDELFSRAIENWNLELDTARAF